jgi:hypothetical protein
MIRNPFIPLKKNQLTSDSLNEKKFQKEINIYHIKKLYESTKKLPGI